MKLIKYRSSGLHLYPFISPIVRHVFFMNLYFVRKIRRDISFANFLFIV